MTTTHGKVLRALMVEDREDDAALVLRELRRVGYEVISQRVENAEDMRRALEGEWDVVISDFSLPQFSGPKALEVLHRSGRDLPFIIVSGTIDEEAAVEALRAGAHDFISKGKLTRLVPAIEREFQDAKARRAHREAERDLRASEERYGRLIESLSEGVCVLDRENCVTYANSRMADILGTTTDAIVGDSLHAHLDEASQRTLSMLLAKPGFEDGRPQEGCVVRADGSKPNVLLTCTRLDAEDGTGESLVMMLDVTDRKTLEEQLRQSQKMDAIGRLAGGVAHDFNNLLTIITSYAQLLAEQFSPSDPRSEDLGEITRAATAAASLTRQLLAFSRQQVVEVREVNLEVTITSIERMLQRLLGEDIQMECILSEEPCSVSIDPGQLEQIILNLVVNARDAMPVGGLLTIETQCVELDEEYAMSHWSAKAGRYALLSVSDNGVGMDEATRIRIFEPFFTTKEIGKGTGLGLSTVYGIVQQSNGFVWVYSEPGGGTTFKIYLPVVQEAAPAEPQVDVDMAQRGTETVLLVEDSPSLRLVARTILERQSYAVLEAPSAAAALELVASHEGPIDLLLTDVVMPGMSGRLLAEQFKLLRPDAKVLYMSGYTDDAVVRHGVLRAGVPYLQKPFGPEVLLRKVRAVLDASDRITGSHRIVA